MKQIFFSLSLLFSIPIFAMQEDQETFLDAKLVASMQNNAALIRAHAFDNGNLEEGCEVLARLLDYHSKIGVKNLTCALEDVQKAIKVKKEPKNKTPQYVGHESKYGYGIIWHFDMEELVALYEGMQEGEKLHQQNAVVAPIEEWVNMVNQETPGRTADMIKKLSAYLTAGALAEQLKNK